jgi:hypothetical protein
VVLQISTEVVSVTWGRGSVDVTIRFIDPKWSVDILRPSLAVQKLFSIFVLV